MHRLASAVFALALASLIPFWITQGTEPSGHAVLTILYGVLGASAATWIITLPYLRWRSPVLIKRINPAHGIVTAEAAHDEAGPVHTQAEHSTQLTIARMPTTEATKLLSRDRVNHLQDIVNELNSIRLRLSKARIDGFYPYNFSLPSHEYHSHKGDLHGRARHLTGQAYVQIDHLNNEFVLRSPEGDSASTYGSDDLPSVIQLLDSAIQAIVQQIDEGESAISRT